MEFQRREGRIDTLKLGFEVYLKKEKRKKQEKSIARQQNPFSPLRLQLSPPSRQRRCKGDRTFTRECQKRWKLVWCRSGHYVQSFQNS